MGMAFRSNRPMAFSNHWEDRGKRRAQKPRVGGSFMASEAKVASKHSLSARPGPGFPALGVRDFLLLGRGPTSKNLPSRMFLRRHLEAARLKFPTSRKISKFVAS